MSSVQTIESAPGFRDQRVGLIIFGILQILIGCIFGLMAPLIVLSAMIPQMGAAQGEAMGLRMMIPSLFIYLVLAGAFIWLGIGSIRARRWAWTLTVVLSWMWLVIGVFSLLILICFMPMMWASIEQQEQARMPPEMILGMQIFTGAIFGCIYLLLPAVFLLFYQRSSVYATCQRRDLQIRWTDRCPMPVLALSLILGYSAISLFSLAAYGFVIPFFGVLISGLPGAIVVLMLIFANAYLAWENYRLKIAAWWGTLLLWIVMSLSSFLTFSRVNLMDMYEKMGIPKSQLEMIHKFGVAEWTSGPMFWLISIFGVMTICYLLYVRRYFIHFKRHSPTTTH
ncbi:MAG: hypothetical protein JXB10_04350 [Pirellulales bacterium]|nr:hypothetical protein [Pirellulales bacterium]